MKRFLPLLIFLPMLLALFAGLGINARLIPSPLVEKPAPYFSLPRLDLPQQFVAPKALKNEVWMLNVWASWCTSCLVEHPLILSLLKGKVPIVGLNYKDNAADASAWLKKWGNPYVFSLSDKDGKVGLDWGVYGVPETFVIDAAGVIRHKHVGPMSATDIQETILPLINLLQEEER